MIATGQPNSSPNATISSVDWMGSSVPGTDATSDAAAAFRDEILSPMTSMASGGGPIQVDAALAMIVRAKSAFSAKNP